MNDDDVVNLLTTMATYDGRKPSEAAILAWTEAATRGRWTFPEALDAVHEHYRHHTDWLMPAHVTQTIRDRRQYAAPRATRPALPAGEHADQTTRAAAMAEIARAIAARRTPEPALPPGYVEDTRRAALKVTCPWCHARPTYDCTRPSAGDTHRRRDQPHPSRVDAARIHEETR